jgi:hypothetical protein
MGFKFVKSNEFNSIYKKCDNVIHSCKRYYYIEWYLVNIKFVSKRNSSIVDNREHFIQIYNCSIELIN